MDDVTIDPNPTTSRTSDHTTEQEVRDAFRDGDQITDLFMHGRPGARRFHFTAPTEQRTVIEPGDGPHIETGSPMFDGLFALALEEVRENSVSAISADGFDDGRPFELEAFETGEMWQYVWTRDISYAVDLSLASLDVDRCVRSLMYKTSGFKASVFSGEGEQILQDTGSGGSYPVSTDRVIWALAAARVRHHLPSKSAQAEWTARTLPILSATIEQDRRLVFNPLTGLYRGEQSFLDWREQTYPLRTKHNVLEIATSESLSTNVAHFIILETAGLWARELGDIDAADRYDGWAEALRTAINDRLYDPEAGLYATFLLTDLTKPIRAHRYDLLGQCLAILSGVADEKRAQELLNRYPTGPHGPPVVHPQEWEVPIYHNHAIWPFVTAYWAKAARHVRHAPATTAAVRSLVRGAALFLSNMENLDVASGQRHGHAHGMCGPAINSRRQLWSVAGYVSMVQDVLFGLETTDSAIRFAPFVPSDIAERFFTGSDSIRLRHLRYRGKTIHVTLELPADRSRGGAFVLAEAFLNGSSIEERFVPFEALASENDWTIRLRSTAEAPLTTLQRIEAITDRDAVFAPATPIWRDVGRDGIDTADGLVRLHFESSNAEDVSYNIYRDGERVAQNVRSNNWTDVHSHDGIVREYAIEAVHTRSGHHSYSSESRCNWPTGVRTFPFAPTMCRLELAAFPIAIDQPGVHVLRIRYANANAAINTGLTCAVKRVDLVNDANEVIVAGDYLILPQTGGAEIEQLSAPLTLRLAAAGAYHVRIYEDDASRNMTYFEHNTRYTGHEGGGGDPCNAICVHAIELQFRATLDA